jgi:amidase
VKTAQPDALGDHRAHHELYLMLLTAVTSARVPEEGRRHTLQVLGTRDDAWAAAQRRGIAGTASDYIVWHAQRERVRAAWRAFFREWDVLLAPAWLGPAFPHADKPYPTTPAWLRHTVEVNGQPVLYELGLAYAAVSTVAGQPATAFPFGHTRAGLPIGLQAIGPYLDDRTPIGFAALLAREWGGFEPPPGYDGEAGARRARA